jgi:serpin B
MKKIILLSVFFAFLQISKAQNITEGNNKFAMNLFHKLANNSSNVFFSPYSISTALFMTAGGAKSQTETQMLDVLCQTENTQAYHQKFGDHLSLVEKKEKIKLNIANSIWMQKGFIFRQDYIDLLSKAYTAKLNESNFKINPDQEAKKISKWVEGRTNNKIKDLIKPGVLQTNTRMVLVNAIYFYGDWGNQFDKENTLEADFYLNNKTTIKAKLMNIEYKMPYASDDIFEVVSVPYSSGEASMLIFLPKSKDNFDKSIQALTFERLNALSGNLAHEKVNLKIPKFTMTTEFELSQTLSTMGMSLAFTDMADFSGMTGEKDLKIDKVIHKAFVDVSEKGTEAAAATAVIMVTKSAGPDMGKTIYFKADHPFIFVIKDNTTGQLLFVGLVNNPAK